MFRFTNLVIFEVTRDCNLHCKYCFMKEKDKYKNERIDPKLFRAVVDQIVQQRLQNDLHEKITLVLHGGECTLLGVKGLYDCFDYASDAFRSHGIPFSLGIQTNGTLINDAMLDLFAEFNVSPGLSFDGVGESNQLRNLSGSYFDNLFKSAKQRGVSFGVLITATRKSIRHMKETFRYLEKNGLTCKVNYVEDMDSPRHSRLEVSSSMFFRYVSKPQLKHFLVDGKIPERNTKSRFERIFMDVVSYHSNLAKIGCGGRYCGTCTGMIGVRPDGTSSVCDRFSKDFPEVRVCNVLDYDFLGLHQLKMAVHMMEHKSDILLSVGCDNCKAQYTCESGCMAFYFSKFHSWGMQKKLVCANELKSYRWVEKNLVRIVRTMADLHVSIEAYWDIMDMKPEIRKKLLSHGLNLYFENNRFHAVRLS